MFSPKGARRLAPATGSNTSSSSSSCRLATAGRQIITSHVAGAPGGAGGAAVAGAIGEAGGGGAAEEGAVAGTVAVLGLVHEALGEEEALGQERGLGAQGGSGKSGGCERRLGALARATESPTPVPYFGGFGMSGGSEAHPRAVGLERQEVRALGEHVDVTLLTKDDDSRRNKRLLRNRVNAQQARERKRHRMEGLEEQCEAIERENAQLEGRIAAIQQENEQLRDAVISLLEASNGLNTSILNTSALNTSTVNTSNFNQQQFLDS
ncbi:hypothetical protein CLOM_g14853 [Closterium sp. NIES-68]|nr:hypothetical protein CLOM_g14853 [Closterium sp. NIES-68]GJP61997.1 hypothetical protein CLOP_g19108 [Closterium sp. NIES-67]